MGRPVWFVNLIKVAFPSRFRLAQMTKTPVIGTILDRLLFEDDDLVYLPLDQTIQIDEPVLRPEEVVLPSAVVEHFINSASAHWIMDACICRDASQCSDYPQNLGCLFLGEAVHGINPKLGRLVTKEEALAHVLRCREAGLVHMVGRNKLDTVWLGVGPGDKLLTICNCCPCCCLWRMLPQVAPEIGAKVRGMPGVTVTVTERCQGCGTCTDGICFADAIHLVDRRAIISDACRHCGRCVDVCPHEAIEISLDGTHVAQTIDRLSLLVEVS